MDDDWMKAFEIDLGLDSESPTVNEDPTPAPPREATPTPPEGPHQGASASPGAESAAVSPNTEPSPASEDHAAQHSPLPDHTSLPDTRPDGHNAPEPAQVPDDEPVPDDALPPDAQDRISWSDKGKGRAASPHSAAAVTPPRTNSSPDTTPDPPTQASPPFRLPLPRTTPSASSVSKEGTPRPQASPISVVSSPERAATVPEPAKATRRAPDVDLTMESDGEDQQKGRKRVKRMRRVEVEVRGYEEDERGEEPTERILGRRYNYPLPPELNMLPAPQRNGGQPLHASDAAFWAAYGNIKSFDAFIRRVAHEDDAVPALPRHMYSMGVEMALVHASTYTRHVHNARRVVAAQDLASKTSRNLGRLRELQEQLQAVNGFLNPSANDDTGTPNGPAFGLNSVRNMREPPHAPVDTQRKAEDMALRNSAVSGPSGSASGSGSGQASGSGSGQASGRGSGSAGVGSQLAQGMAERSMSSTSHGLKRKRAVTDTDSSAPESPVGKKQTRPSRDSPVPPTRPPAKPIMSGWVEEALPGPRLKPKPGTAKKPLIRRDKVQTGGPSGRKSAPVMGSGSGSGASGRQSGWMPHPPRMRKSLQEESTGRSRPKALDYLDFPDSDDDFDS
ncbi:unnamed protein product [Peniophora sp. CBMAI 1063]|nr:unnamed protein product [Peniophora sp. CBMAI 1063]